MMVLLARHWTRLICKAWIGTASFAAVVGRVCVPAGLFFVFVSGVGILGLGLIMVEGLILIVVEVFLGLPLLLLLFLIFVLGMERVGHAPFRFLFFLS
jgi:ABC-type amino acid transport system permease subunit